MGIIQSFLFDGKTGNNEQQPETREQFSKLQQISEDPLREETPLGSPHTSPEVLNKSHDDPDDIIRCGVASVKQERGRHDDRHDIIRCGVASVKQERGRHDDRHDIIRCGVASVKQERGPKENYSNINDVDRFIIALRGFEYSLASTSVSEEIILDHSNSSRQVLPSSVTTRERVRENGNIVRNIGEQRRKRRTKRKTIKTIASESRVGVSEEIILDQTTILPSSGTTREGAQENNRNNDIDGKARKRRTKKKTIKTAASEEILDQTTILTSSLTKREETQENSSNNIVEKEEKGRKRRTKRKTIKTVLVKETTSVVVVNEVRWIKHYSNFQRMLLVGEGDFSFSACLAVAFGIASNMIATSLNSKEYLKKNYQIAEHNLEELTNRGCKVVHGIDATKMANHTMLKRLKFDRIVFNFPFAGFFKGIPRETVLRHHRRLVSKFLKNAKKMISEGGEIHISHKTNGIHNEWNLESIASSNGLRLIEAVKFKLDDYPGYNTKRGFGGDDNFPCYPSKTFKFGPKMV